MCVRFHRPVASLLATLGLSLGLGCSNGASGPAPRPPSVDLPLADSQFVQFDAAAPFFDFGGEGSVVLGAGWGRAEQSDLPPRWFSWMLDGKAAVWVPRPIVVGAERPAFDFVAEVMPFAWTGRPAQRLTVWHGEQALGHAVLDDGWAHVRIALPEGALAARDNELVLRASHTQQPSVVAGSADTRVLSIAFRSLAIVPRGVTQPSERHVQLRDAALTIPAGGALAIPLPTAQRVSVALGSLQADEGLCTLDVGFRQARDEAALWSGAVSAAPEVIEVETPAGAVGQLTLGWRSSGDRCAPLTVPLDEDLLTRDASTEDRTTAAEAADRTLAPPPVFVYLIDTLRADALAPFGGDLDVSPHAAAFATEAVTYPQAWSASAWTLPATLSVLTGVYPDRHGVMTGRVAFDAATIPTLAARLGARGYATAGLSQSLVAGPHFGIDAGFEHFELRDELNGVQLGSPRLRRRLVRWLSVRSEDDTRPLFAYLHSVDPHAPYAPEGADRRFAEQHRGTLSDPKYHPITFQREGLGGDPRDVAHLQGLYDGEVAFTDRQLGHFLQLLRHLDLYDRSVIVVLSDHGEEFAEHGGFGHGRTLFEEQLRVPLMVKYPHQQWAGQRIERPVSTVDLVPTLLALASGQSAVDTQGLDGRSLLPPDLATPEPRPLLGLVAPEPAEGLAGVDYRAFRLGNLKCIESQGATDQFGQPAPPWQVFDLAADPGEQQPLAADDRRAERCQRLLGRWLAQRADMATTPHTGDDIDDETLEQLRALGYLGG